MPFLFLKLEGGGRREQGIGFALPLCAVLLACSLLSSCAAKDFTALRAGLDERGHYIEGVPFYRQKEGSCGPAALASVSSFWGRQVSLDEITARVYLPALRGTLPMDMEQYLREAGFQTTSLSGTLEDLKARIRRNSPVICLLDLGFSLYRQPHYVTVIGFDDTNRVIIAHDGETANAVIGYDRFLKQWKRAGNWMVIALPRTSQTKETP